MIVLEFVGRLGYCVALVVNILVATLSRPTTYHIAMLSFVFAICSVAIDAYHVTIARPCKRYVA